MNGRLLFLFIILTCNQNIFVVLQAGESAKTVSLQRVGVRDIIGVLRFDYKVRLHFEEMVYDSTADSISLHDEIQRLETIPSGSINEREKTLLATLRDARRQLIQNGKDKTVVVDYTHKRFDIEFTSTSDKVLNTSSVLKAMIEKDAGYVWKESNGSYIVCPKDAIYPAIKSFQLSNADEDTARVQLHTNVLAPLKLMMLSVRKTPNPKRINLNLKDVDIYTCLTRFAESLGPDRIWTIMGTKELRVVEFGHLAERIVSE